ncbi:MAG TPA: hypothetical protein VL442_15175 [Mucilaginibacter sp.]|jgi:hypothetical protein|nr:hypothetical protein [Mucilaginibacter sp.]
MNRKILIALALVCCAIAGLAAVFADVNGKWKGTLMGPDGNPLDVSYTIKVDGDKLTGEAFAQDLTLKIDSGKINGTDFKFSVTNPEGVTIPHNGKYIAQGDSISMNVDYQGFKMHSTLKRSDK